MPIDPDSYKDQASLGTIKDWVPTRMQKLQKSVTIYYFGEVIGSELELL